MNNSYIQYALVNKIAETTRDNPHPRPAEQPLVSHSVWSLVMEAAFRNKMYMRDFATSLLPGETNENLKIIRQEVSDHELTPEDKDVFQIFTE